MTPNQKATDIPVPAKGKGNAAKTAAAAPEGKEFKGRIKVVETNNDQAPEDYDLELTWIGGSPTGPAFSSIRKMLLGVEMRSAIRGVMKKFEEDFKTL